MCNQRGRASHPIVDTVMMARNTASPNESSCRLQSWLIAISSPANTSQMATMAETNTVKSLCVGHEMAVWYHCSHRSAWLIPTRSMLNLRLDGDKLAVRLAACARKELAAAAAAAAAGHFECSQLRMLHCAHCLREQH